MSLCAHELSIGYDTNTLVKRIHFELKSGEVFCLLGPNGCGKSTLIKTLLNLIAPCAGEVRVNHVPLQQLSKTALAKQLAYVPQNHSNSLGFSVADMVLMGRSLYWGLFRGPTHTDYQEVDQALELLGIIDLKEHDFNLLSGGQQQLVFIARALCQGANTLVLDEPTAHLDFANAAKVIRTLAGLAEQGKSVLFSTHNPQDALNIGTHACLIKDHAVLAQGTVREVITSRNLSQVYGLPMVVSHQCKCVLLGNCESSGNSACINSPSGFGYSGEPQSSQ